MIGHQVAERIKAGLSERGEVSIRGRLEVAPGEARDFAQESAAELVVLVPQTAPLRQPPKNGSAVMPLIVTTPWWIS